MFVHEGQRRMWNGKWKENVSSTKRKNADDMVDFVKDMIKFFSQNGLFLVDM